MLARCAVVLVGTQNPENLGGVARLVENFAPAELALVAPRAQPDDPRALVVGRMARERLAAARVTATLDEAVREAACVVGFSARRGAGRPMVALRDLPARVPAAGGIALVFGPEDAGLSAEDVDRCDLVATIDLPGALPSLNLTQAVAIALWELARGGDAAPAARAAASHAELEALIARVPQIDERGRAHLRRLLVGAGLEPADVRALHGWLRALER